MDRLIAANEAVAVIDETPRALLYGYPGYDEPKKGTRIAYQLLNIEKIKVELKPRVKTASVAHPKSEQEKAQGGIWHDIISFGSKNYDL